MAVPKSEERFLEAKIRHVARNLREERERERRNKWYDDQHTGFIVVKLPTRAAAYECIRHGHIQANDEMATLRKNCMKIIVFVSCVEAFGPCIVGYGLAGPEIVDASKCPVRDLPENWRQVMRIGWVKVGTVPNVGGTDSDVLERKHGVALCDAVNASAESIIKKALPTRTIQTKVTKQSINIGQLPYQDYVVTVLNKRRQQLKRARALGAQVEESAAKKSKLAPPTPPMASRYSMPRHVPAAGRRHPNIPHSQGRPAAEVLSHLAMKAPHDMGQGGSLPVSHLPQGHIPGGAHQPTLSIIASAAAPFYPQHVHPNIPLGSLSVFR